MAASDPLPQKLLEQNLLGMPPTPLQRPDDRGLRVLVTALYPLSRCRTPPELSRSGIEAFQTFLAHRHRPASSQAQALNALVLLYRNVLQTPFDGLERLDRLRSVAICTSGESTSRCARPIAGQLHGLLSCSECTDVPLSVLRDEARVVPKAQWILIEAATLDRRES